MAKTEIRFKDGRPSQPVRVPVEKPVKLTSPAPGEGFKAELARKANQETAARRAQVEHEQIERERRERAANRYAIRYGPTHSRRR